MHVLCSGLGGAGIRNSGEAETLRRNLQHLRDLAQHSHVLGTSAALQAAHLRLVISKRGGNVPLRAPL
ncbi:hypothetical protein SZN_01539 [Streptomyces zinciresistens K42]|uniref:Uncharacterized protein n=1 Tax=Streptomyces zinciresistens K42 TaxID=700597 RepID=G2G4A6_9ACTN|nr:hypothetical protein SZN_01539 [Streptomyces zinciresistens K42]